MSVSNTGLFSALFFFYESKGDVLLLKLV